jgi:hypothetical protein
MDNLNITPVDLVSTLRTAAKNGPPSSSDYNDSLREMLADLGSLAETVNLDILPLLNALPATAVGGLDGAAIYAARDTGQTLFYDQAGDRYLTVAEVLSLLDNRIQRLQTVSDDLKGRIVSLQTRLATNNQYDVVKTVQGFTQQLNSVAFQVSALSRTTSSHSTELDGIRKVRVSVSVGADQTAVQAVTWSPAYPDDSYTVALSVEGVGAEIVSWAKKQDHTGIDVTVRNTSDSDVQVVLHAVAQAD